MCLGSPRWPTIQFIEMIKDVKFILKQQTFLQSNTFLFLITNRNIQASWKMKFLRPRKVSSSSLKFNYKKIVWFFSSSPISNLITKSVEPVLKMGLGDDTIVVTREWLQCSKLKIWDKCSFVNWIGLSITESRYDGWQFLDLPWWNISKDWFCCRTFGLKVWRGLGKY